MSLATTVKRSWAAVKLTVHMDDGTEFIEEVDNILTGREVTTALFRGGYEHKIDENWTDYYPPHRIPRVRMHCPSREATQ